mgnify:CR=1 FL=1
MLFSKSSGRATLLAAAGGVRTCQARVCWVDEVQVGAQGGQHLQPSSKHRVAVSTKGSTSVCTLGKSTADGSKQYQAAAASTAVVGASNTSLGYAASCLAHLFCIGCASCADDVLDQPWQVLNLYSRQLGHQG